MRRRRIADVQQRAGDRGQVGAVHQRQRGQLDEDGDVVRVAHEAVRARRSPRRAASTRTTRTFQCTPSVAITQKRSAFASTTSASAGIASAGDERARAAAATSSDRADEDAGVQRDHRARTPARAAARRRRAASARWCRRDRRISTRRQAPTAPTSTRKKIVEPGACQLHPSSSISVVEARAERRQHAVRSRPAAAAASATRAARTAPTRSTGCRSRAARPTTAACRRAARPSSSSTTPRILRPPGCSTKQDSCSRVSPRRAASVPHQRRDLALEQRRHVLREHRVEAVVLADRSRARRSSAGRCATASRGSRRAPVPPAPPRRRPAPPPPRRRRTAPSTTRFAGDRSARCMLRLGSSTAITSTRAPGKPTRKSCARASAAAPPAQPSSVIGSRRTSGRKPELVDQVGVERRDHDPGARRGDDQIDVGGGDAARAPAPRAPPCARARCACSR